MTQAEFSAWPGLDEVVSCDEGASPRKYREMSTLGAAVSTKRPCCIEAMNTPPVQAYPGKRSVKVRCYPARCRLQLTAGPEVL